MKTKGTPKKICSVKNGEWKYIVIGKLIGVMKKQRSKICDKKYSSIAVAHNRKEYRTAFSCYWICLNIFLEDK